MGAHMYGGFQNRLDRLKIFLRKLFLEKVAFESAFRTGTVQVKLISVKLRIKAKKVKGIEIWKLAG